MLDKLTEMMLDQFPFLDRDEADLTLRLCEKNNRLFYFPKEEPVELLGYYQFFPELINAVRRQEFDVLMRCDLTAGPLVYVAALITPGNALRTITMIVRTLNARAYAYHRYKDEDYEFHFVRNNHYRVEQTGTDYARQQ